jgi:hypothetical protein
LRTRHAGDSGSCYGETCECTQFRCDHTRCGWKPREEPEYEAHDFIEKGHCAACAKDFEDQVKRARMIPRPEPKRLSLTTVCACSHVNNWHVRTDHNDTHCAAVDCPCGAFRASSEDEKSLPPCTCGPDEACGDPCDYESRCNGCGHHGGEGCGCPAHAFVSFEHCDRCAGTWLLRNAGEEPPLTPEEEEEAAPEVAVDDFGQPIRECYACDRVGCSGCAPPQPERRPPYAVAYSVQGHLFEVALPGDATVRAVDGALVIQHHLGPVAGIVSVLPVINKES